MNSTATIAQLQKRSSAHWIWTDEPVDEPDQMGQFRLNFRVKSNREVRWIGYADTLYTIWCNGHVLGVGPVSGTNENPWATEWDLTRYAREGENVLALQVWSQGNRPDCLDTGALEAGVIGWLLVDEDVIPTGSAWLARNGKGFQMPAPEGYRAFAANRLIIADLREEPLEWFKPEYTDDEWKPARSIHAFDHPRREALWMSPIPPMSCELLPPPAVKDAGWAKGNREVQFAVDVAQRMAEQEHQSLLCPTIELGHPSSKRGQARGLPEPKSMGWSSLDFPLDCPNPPAGADFYLTLDLGAQTSGCLLFTIETRGECTMDVTYGDHLAQGRVNPVLQQEVADRVILPAGKHSSRLPHDRGCRYLQINLSTTATIHDLCWEEHLFPHSKEERFSCSDRALSAIWRAAQRTVQQNSLTHYTDNARRERAAFMGPDFMHTWRGGFAACGDLQLARKHLISALTHADHLPEGLIPGRALGNGPSEWLRAFDYHDLHFPIFAWDYLLHSDDRELAPRLLAAAEKLLAHQDQRTDNGVKANLGGWRWSGWSLMTADSVVTSSNLLLIQAYRAVAQIQQYLGDAGALEQWAREEKTLVENIFRELVDEERQVLCQGLDKTGRRVPFCSQADNALALCLGIVPESEVRRYHEFCAGESGLWPTNRTGWQGGATGELARRRPDKMIVAGCPTDSFIVAEAIAKLESEQAAIDYLRYNFGSAVDEGEGTFWECWPMVTETSVSQRKDATCYSQGWGSGVAFVILRLGLGVSVVSPAGQKLRWRPGRVSTARMCGKIKTGSGDVTLGWDSHTLFWSIPDGIEITVEPLNGESFTIHGPDQKPHDDYEPNNAKS